MAKLPVLWCTGNPYVTKKPFPREGSVTRSFYVFFVVSLKQLFKEQTSVIWDAMMLVWRHILHGGFTGTGTVHGDVIKWKHFPRYWPFVRGFHRSSVDSPYKDQYRGAMICSLICALINGWANDRDACDLRRHRAHYDVTVMLTIVKSTCAKLRFTPLCLALLYPSDVIYWYLCKFNCWHKLNVHVHNLLMILGPHIKSTHLKNIPQQFTDSVLYLIGFIFNCAHGMTQTVFRNTADYK